MVDQEHLDSVSENPFIKRDKASMNEIRNRLKQKRSLSSSLMKNPFIKADFEIHKYMDAHNSDFRYPNDVGNDNGDNHCNRKTLEICGIESNPFIIQDRQSRSNSPSKQTTRHLYSKQFGHSIKQNPFIHRDINGLSGTGLEPTRNTSKIEYIDVPEFVKSIGTPDLAKESRVTVSLRSTVVENEIDDLESIHATRKLILDRMIIEVTEQVKILAD